MHVAWNGAGQPGTLAVRSATDCVPGEMEPWERGVAAA